MPMGICNFIFGLLNAFYWIRKPIFNYREAVKRAHVAKAQLNFLKGCLDNKVIPKTLLPRRFTSRPGVPFTKAAEEVLNEKISEVKQEVDFKFWHIRRMFEVVKRSLLGIPGNELYLITRIVDFAHLFVNKETAKVVTRLNKRFNNLFQDSPWYKFSKIDSVINLSAKQLNIYEKIALGFGFSFDLGVTAETILDTFKNLEIFAKKYNVAAMNDINVFKGAAFGSVLSEIKKGLNFPKVLLEALATLKKDSTRIVTKADKGNKVVVLDRADYIVKMNDLLNDGLIYRKLRKDPLSDDQRYFNRSLKDILGNNLDSINNFSARLPSMPYMYGLPKIHKEGVPMRPIISNIGSISYKLSHWLAKVLNKFVGSISNSHIKNSEDFIQKIKNENVMGKKVMSFDVKSLFTNVPLDLTLEFLDRYLVEVGCDSLPFGKNVFLKLLKLSLSISNFCFNGEFYKQIWGLAMGNPLSPILSNIFMEGFERFCLPDFMDDRVVWKRYVDDIFVIMPDDIDVDMFLLRLNGVCERFVFTIEHESVIGLPFLDVPKLEAKETIYYS